MAFTIIFLVTVLAATAGLSLLTPYLVKLCGRVIGNRARTITEPQRELLLERAEKEQKEYEEQGKGQSSLDDEWEKVEKTRVLDNGPQTKDGTDAKNWRGIIGFFHPFCNAGGGGERVLWAAIRVTQRRWPNAVCVVYTGDQDVDKDQILQRVKDRFNIHLHPPTLTFIYLTTRHYVLATTWPHFTLLGQSLGSLFLAIDAFSLLVPDVFIDTMGYAFTLALTKWLFPTVPTAAYVHYPTISTDMLQSLDSAKGDAQGLHAGLGKGWRGEAKRRYWHLFAALYGRVGASVDVVMTNSSWTQAHIRQLWGLRRAKSTGAGAFPIDVVFPPVAVEELAREVAVSPESEGQREATILYIAQFRPEKNHALVLEAFAQFLHGGEHGGQQNVETRAGDKRPQLVLIGSVRDSADETHVYSLRLLAHELKITDRVTFLVNAAWPEILTRLRTASVGVNAMWNEHFGIGVVEYQAAGLISVVNDSGGPKEDIVVDDGDGPTGFHAATAEQYAEGFAKAFGLSREEKGAMRARARRSAERFNEAAFEEKWVAQMERLLGLQMKLQTKERPMGS